MGHPRYAARSNPPPDPQPFTTSEEAWLWYARCQVARDEGARFTAGQGEVARPCDPDDIVREVQRLYRGRVLRPAHLTVLARFGRRLAPPDPAAGDSKGAAGLWDEALDRLATPLRHKGIVA